MTQIIAALTQEYVLLASDRRLTYGEGPKKGQIYDDDTCKLVSLCGTTGIAYSGVGEMKGRVPTHEWIAKTLAEAGCRDAQTAERTLLDRAPSGLSATPRELRRHIFLFAGWAHFEAPPVLRPYFAAITNFLDASGQRVLEPLDSFNASRRYLRQQETHLCSVSGEALSKARADLLERNLRRLIDREIGPKEATRLLVEEVINTSKQCSTVGFKVLAFCIPKKGAEQFFSKGTAVMLAAEPNTETTSFSYFEDGYVELQQFGPTLTCSGFATTDIKTENDESQNRQSSQVRILALPKSVAQSAPRTGPIFKSRRMARSIIAFEFGISVDSAVVPGAFYKIPAAIRNTGDVPIVFAKGLSDDVGQEVPPSVQGGAVPAITLGWPTGEWSIVNFEAVSRTQFAGVVIAPGDVFGFDFGSFTVPNAPAGSACRSGVVDFSIRFTDTIIGQLLNASGAEFHFPTNVNQTLMFRIAAKSAPSELQFNPARVIETATGELISGPVDGSPPVNSSSIFTDTSISKGKPGVATKG